MYVELIHVTKRFQKVTAVDDLSVGFEDGKLTALLGPSGCGKTTVLNALAGILPVTGGRILFDGEDVTRLPPERRGIGLVFQNYALYPHMTVLKNICFPLEIQKVPARERLERAMEIARLVHVEELLDRLPAQLSGGQQQRVAIARALVKRPRLLLLDEPLSNLDARLRLETREEIRRVQLQTGVTTVFVTHDQEEAMSISDSIALMRDGRLQQFERPQRLYDEPANRFVAEFLGSPPINRFEGRMVGGEFALSDGSASIPFPRGAGIAGDRGLILAIRAESAYEAMGGAAGGTFSCLVKGLYEIGKDRMATLLCGNAEFRAFLSPEGSARLGGELRIAIRDRGAFLFDAGTGERIV